jgi:formate hydrogenlyase subunit 6/NADH:ubiquinone oxidoreductase subunit I
VKLLKTYLDRCVQCGACMSACSKAWAKEDSPELSRIRVKAVAGMTDIRVCDQCGGCIAVCPTMALSRDKNGIVSDRQEEVHLLPHVREFCPSASMYFSTASRPPTRRRLRHLCYVPAPKGHLKS